MKKSFVQWHDNNHNGKMHHGGDARAPTTRFHKREGSWVLIASPRWELKPGDLVSVVRREGPRRILALGEFIGNTGTNDKSHLDCKDMFSVSKGE